MATLRPFRDYSEHDVINLFAFDYSGTDIDAGNLVQIKSAAGFSAHDNLGQDATMLWDNSGLTNIVSDRYSVNARVELAGSGETPLGMMLYGCKEVDENGEKLIYNPHKAAEMQVTVSGQAVPVVTRGLFLVNNVDGTPTAGSLAYCGGDAAGDGKISATSGGSKVTIGRFLGPDTNADGTGDVLLKLEL